MVLAFVRMSVVASSLLQTVSLLTVSSKEVCTLFLENFSLCDRSEKVVWEPSSLAISAFYHLFLFLKSMEQEPLDTDTFCKLQICDLVYSSQGCLESPYP